MRASSEAADGLELSEKLTSHRLRHAYATSDQIRYGRALLVALQVCTMLCEPGAPDGALAATSA
jgi:hypothetical protein